MEYDYYWIRFTPKESWNCVKSTRSDDTSVFCLNASSCFLCELTYTNDTKKSISGKHIYISSHEKCYERLLMADVPNLLTSINKAQMVTLNHCAPGYWAPRGCYNVCTVQKYLQSFSSALNSRRDALIQILTKKNLSFLMQQNRVKAFSEVGSAGLYKLYINASNTSDNKTWWIFKYKWNRSSSQVWSGRGCGAVCHWRSNLIKPHGPDEADELSLWAVKSQ